jgi:low temperature requirement protein LtrA
VRGLTVPDPDEDFTADPVELFFDLAFVFAFAQLTLLLIGDPTWSGAGRALLLFALLWMPWSQFTWSANAVPGNTRPVRIVFLVATAASVPMAAAVPTAFGAGGVLFAVPLSVIFLSALTLMLLGLDNDTAEYASSVRYAAPSIVAMAVIVIGAFVDGDGRTAVWVVGLAIFVAATLRAGGDDWLIRPGHFAERHGLIIIIALGEVIVALGNSVRTSLVETGGFARGSVVTLVAAGVLAGLLWWAYFDRVQPAFERRADDLQGQARARFVRDVYTYAHLPLVVGIVFIAAALEELTLHPTDPLPLAFRTIGFVGFLLYAGAVTAGVWRAFQVPPVERIVAVVAIAVLLFGAGDLDGVVVLIVIDVIILLALIMEHRRIERPRDAAGAAAQSA